LALFRATWRTDAALIPTSSPSSLASLLAVSYTAGFSSLGISTISSNLASSYSSVGYGSAGFLSP